MGSGPSVLFLLGKFEKLCIFNIFWGEGARPHWVVGEKTILTKVPDPIVSQLVVEKSSDGLGGI